MPRPYTGKESVSYSEVKKANGSIYVYERTTWYDRESKKTRSKRRLLGIKDPETGKLLSTRQRRKRTETETEANEGEAITVSKKENARVSILSYLSDASGVTREVTAATQSDRGLGEKILTLAWYAFSAEGGFWTGAENWTRSFQNDLPYRTGPITEEICQELFREIGNHEELKWYVFKMRAQQMGEDELLALDSTIASATETIQNERKDKDEEETVEASYKVVYIYSVTARQLIAYDVVSGKIPDCSTVDTALTHLDRLGLGSSMEVVRDNGPATDEDIGDYLHRKRHFIAGLEPNRKWIRDEVEKALKELQEGDPWTSMIRSDPSFVGKAIRISHTFPYHHKYGGTEKKTGDRETISAWVNVFIYYSSKMKGEDDERFRMQFDQVREDVTNGAYLDEEDRAFLERYCIATAGKYGMITDVTLNARTYREKMKYSGILVVVTDKETDIESAFTKFRSRETIEEGVEGQPGQAGGELSKPGRTYESLDGELFVRFLASSMRESLRTRLQSLNASLGVPNGVRDHDLRENLEAEAKVKSWIREESIADLIEYFERKEVTILSDGKKIYEMDGSRTSRDGIFLRQLGVTQDSSGDSEDGGTPS